MFLSYFTLLIALSLSTVAAWYSVLGLTAIFASAVIPVIIMGTMLELAKVTVTVWLHEYWHRCQILMKLYLVSAVVVLMIITSLGVFGFLSKAHSDNSLVSGDVQSRIAVYDEKIKTQKDNIEAARKALKQMDEGVDQVLGRSTSETGANRAVAVRKSQQKERAQLQAEIQKSQQSISQLADARAPIAAEVRKVEAEVGPIKYIAAMVYGDDPGANLLERAVRWVIILLVVVFDPLAIMMILAAGKSMKWAKQDQESLYIPYSDTVAVDKIEQIHKTETVPVKLNEADLGNCSNCDTPLFHARGIGPVCANQDCDTTGPHLHAAPQSMFDQHAYLNTPFVHFKNLKPMVAHDSTQDKEIDAETEDPEQDQETADLRWAKGRWKELNPGQTLKSQRAMLARGEIAQLPWLLVQRETHQGFGDTLPVGITRGDTFIKTNTFPNQMYKFNGDNWILVDKSHTDNYTYDTAYVDHLIAKIVSGEYDPDLLTQSDSEQVAQRLRTNNNT